LQTEVYKEKVRDFQMTDAEVQKVIRRKVDESVESAFGVLREKN
jgi:SecD/SecF fusion protein